MRVKSTPVRNAGIKVVGVNAKLSQTALRSERLRSACAMLLAAHRSADFPLTLKRMKSRYGFDSARDKGKVIDKLANLYNVIRRVGMGTYDINPYAPPYLEHLLEGGTRS
jgi:hypothetical protein